MYSYPEKFFPFIPPLEGGVGDVNMEETFLGNYTTYFKKLAFESLLSMW